MNTQHKPGQIVQHPEKGFGYTFRLTPIAPVVSAMYATKDERIPFSVDHDLTGWEPIEVVKPGHVQVRVDDLHEMDYPRGVLDLRAWQGWVEWAKQQNESHKEPASSETLTDSDARNLTGATVNLACDLCDEPITAHVAREQRPGTTMRGVRLTSVNVHRHELVEPVRLMHPEPTQRGAKATFTFHDGDVLHLLRIYDGQDRVWQSQCGTRWTWEELTYLDGDDRRGSLTLGWEDGLDVSGLMTAGLETIKRPAPIDEPQEFGARVTVTRPDGTREPWLRVDTYTKRPWLSEAAGFDRSWNQVKQRGTIALGWVGEW